MAELDYAFLADYATISEGRLTAVGASFTHVFVPQLPVEISFAVAGRLRVREDEEAPELKVRFAAEESNFEATVSGVVHRSPESLPYDGKVGILFTLAAGVPVAYEGLVQVEIFVNGEHQRYLAYEVKDASKQAE
ncbi:DUF6941 family protein [Brevibacterium otitidis]|uniref:DUF6941 family protein n=1 Tax=Brevibacterium otitidis TaxID=53364 RepID=A0ABV5X1P8_9MICO